MPNFSNQFALNTIRSAPRARNSKGGKRIALAVLAICAVWAIWQTNQQSRIAPAREALLADLSLLWDWSDDRLIGGAGNAEWNVRWNVTADPGSMERLIGLLFADQAGNVTDTAVEHNGSVVKGVLPASGGRLTVSLTAAADTSEQLMLLYEPADGAATGKEGLLQAAKAVSEEIETITSKYTNSMNVKGLANQRDAPRLIASAAKARRIDSYADGGTVSDSYFTAKLKNEVITDGGRRINLQLAVHTNTETESYELVAGVPVITGDYTVQVFESSH